MHMENAMKRAPLITLGFLLLSPFLAVAQNTQTPPAPPAAPRHSFCSDYVLFSNELLGLVWWFFIPALVLGIAYAIVETVKKFMEESAPGGRKEDAGTLKDLIEALKAFFEALASARAWLALFACGLLLLLVAGHGVPANCGDAMKAEYVKAASSN
jgi:hypothetical protein